MRLHALFAGVVGIGLVLASTRVDTRPILVWNASPSLPVGLYGVMAQPPQLGDRVLARLPPRLAALAARRGYLAPTAYLLKPVAAINGDRVCRLGDRIYVRGRFAARAKARDRARRALPTWQGCQTLRPGEVFLLAPDPDSFDSRYFGGLPHSAVAACAVLIWSSR